jgi:hypothetical protein
MDGDDFDMEIDEISDNENTEDGGVILSDTTTTIIIIITKTHSNIIDIATTARRINIAFDDGENDWYLYSTKI